MSEMRSDKQQRVIEASWVLFGRHGFKQVTMGDIAYAADMSRPALYLVFANKEEVFRAVLADFRDRRLAEIRAGLGRFDGLAAKLAFALEIWVVRPFQMVIETPCAIELIQPTHAFADDLLADADRAFERIVTALLEDRRPALEARGLSPASVAPVLVAAARGAQGQARDGAALQALMAALVGLTNAAASEGTTAPKPRFRRQD